MNDHPGHKREIFSYRRVIAAMLAVLLLILALVNFTLLKQQRRAHLAQTETQISYQLAAAAAFLTEPLLKYRFADVEEFLRLLFTTHEDVLLLEAHSPSGHLLSRFSREGGSPFVISRRQEVLYQGRHLLTLSMQKDYAQTEAILIEMRNRLLAVSIMITAVLGLMLWVVFRRLAIEPLEQEISRRRRAEQEMAATNRELDAFAYSISHDLRAPLRGIDGFSLALQEDYEEKLDAEGKDYIRRIRSGCVRMGLLIDDMLQLSRLSRSEIKRGRVDLSALAGEITAELRKSAPERQVLFNIEPGVTVEADPVLLRAVLENLLSNAWKFTAKITTPEISFGRIMEDGEQICFVRDNGAGFDMTYADKLFTPFQRLHTVREFEGTGIGLATVQRIIHRHGGRIWAESQVNKGAVFYFTV
ncbi:ATP-binding protein [Desulfurivibrio sp. D14AmB]|uniref:sensor histidine kinase n=1 Tax=Desulfurivibrio sp. D14AmB TaxID=3374370 RepID=UPI00376F1CA1